jgi:hypothetical protein
VSMITMKMPGLALTVVSLVSFVFLMPADAHAQMYETVGTRAQGMGGAFVAVLDDATATWWNPAGLILTYFSAVIEQTRFDDPAEQPAGGPATRSETRSFAVAFPALGLSYYRLRISEIAPPASTGAGGPGRQDIGVTGGGVRSLVTHQLGATIGQSVGNHLILASTVKLVRAGTSDASAGTLDDAATLDVPFETSGDLDVGALARFGSTRVGVSVKHVNEPSFGEGASQFVLSRQARVGVAWVGGQPGAPAVITTSLDADLTKTATLLGDVRHVAGGAELHFTRERLAVRGGVSANTIGDATYSGSFGLSLGVAKGWFLDGAKTFGSDKSRSGWGVSVRLTI